MAFGHGKVILLGEHGVVHGRPALALAVERGAEARAFVHDGPTNVMRIEPWGVQVDDGPEEDSEKALLQRALRVATGFFEDALRTRIDVMMRLPGGAGMGSSAAIGVAVLRALEEVRGLAPDDERIYQRSLRWEGVFHGNPSGVDNAMATWGGLACFVRGAPLERITPALPVRVVASFSGSSSGTREMVASVASQLAREPARVTRIFDAMETLVHAGRRAIEVGDLVGLGAAMSENHALLQALSLSTATLDDMVSRALAAGALGAKVTGAGGGGCMIALVDSVLAARRVSDALSSLGHPTWDVVAEG